MCEFSEDLKSRMVGGMLTAGIAVDIAHSVANDVLHGLLHDRAGERILISKSGARMIERAARDRAIIRDWKNGERVPLLARRWKLSRVRIWQIVYGK